MEDNQDSRYHYKAVVDILAEMVIAYLSQSQKEHLMETDQDGSQKAA
jgi:hypothetical protein